MDIIVEGKIDADERISDVIGTVMDLKNLPTVILRISDNDNELHGRVAFSGNGYILGGRTESGETGYPAIKRLFSITTGNYAILDPGRTHIPESNQTLWISVERLLPLLPNLPNDFGSLVDGGEIVVPTGEKVKTGHINLYTKEWKEEARPATVQEMSSKARRFDPIAWSYTKFFVGLIAALAVVVVLIFWGDKLAPFLSLLPYYPKN